MFYNRLEANGKQLFVRVADEQKIIEKCNVTFPSVENVITFRKSFTSTSIYRSDDNLVGFESLQNSIHKRYKVQPLLR